MSSILDQRHSLRTRWALARNRVVGSERFQEWAARTPLVRRIARAKAADQFDLIAGFVYSQITSVFVQSGLLAMLREAPRKRHDVAQHVRLDDAATNRLLKAGAAIGLAEETQPGLWTLGERGAALSANAGALAMIEHHALLYRDLADPAARLGTPGGGELAQFWTYASNGEDGHAAYSQLMRATQPMVWQQVIGNYPFARHRAMLDVGGGSGAFVAAVADTAPRLSLGLFDLPEVAAIARERFADSPRVQIHGGSFRNDPIPNGYDLVTLVRILHDHDDAVAQHLLGAIADSLEPGDRLLIVEPMAATRGGEAMGDAYFGIYLWAMGTGRPRTAEEIRAMLAKAGFSSVSERSTPLPIVARMLVATR